MAYNMGIHCILGQTLKRTPTVNHPHKITIGIHKMQSAFSAFIVCFYDERFFLVWYCVYRRKKKEKKNGICIKLSRNIITPFDADFCSFPFFE